MKQMIVLLLGILLCGCAIATPTIKATKELDIQSLGMVAVLPFNGHHGDQFADSVAQEFMIRGARIVERSRIISVLMEQGMSVADITSGRINYEKIGGLLGVDTIVVGSVSPIVVYASGAPSGKVSTAAMRLVSVNTGAVVGSATYAANTELLAGSVLYPEAAERLVRALIEGKL
jgi:hypothetical protein